MADVPVHDGPGVLPGRYAGPAVLLHDGPSRQQVEGAGQRSVAEDLADRICADAALETQAQCQLLELIGDFDATGAVACWTDMKSVAHWLSWACAMAPGTAREHVRVARALRRAPSVAAAFATGELSYSKVREITRVVDLVDEARLCELARAATAPQLARMIAGYRSASGTRIRQQPKRAMRWRNRDDGMVDISIQLPAEEAAEVIAAVAAAKAQYGTPPPKPTAPATTTGASGDQVETTPTYTAADALLDVARGFLNSTPEDRSGEDRTLVVVHVAAEALDPSLSGNVPAGTPPTPSADRRDPSGDVPAGTSPTTSQGPGPGDRAAHGVPDDPTCHVDGIGPVEPETAARLACDSPVLGAVVDRHGEVLALGRTRRLVSRAQRRALMIRDRMCRFPGCHQVRHLKAHHVISWARGGRTDLDNLVLLCQWHHTAVHEGGMRIRRVATVERWQFVMPDGTPHRPWHTADRLPYLLADQLDQENRLEGVSGLEELQSRTVRPAWVGERADLHACVEALFAMTLPEAGAEAGAEAA